MNFLKDIYNKIFLGNLRFLNVQASVSSNLRNLALDENGNLVTGNAGDVPTISYNDLTDVPTSFTPSAHTHNASDINAGTLNIARIPTGTTATTVALGNHTQAFTTITGVATTAQIPSLAASKITSGTFAIAQTNSVLTGFAVGTNTAVAATDTLLQAIGKLQAQIADLQARVTALETP